MRQEQDNESNFKRYAYFTFLKNPFQSLILEKENRSRNKLKEFSGETFYNTDNKDCIHEEICQSFSTIRQISYGLDLEQQQSTKVPLTPSQRNRLLRIHGPELNRDLTFNNIMAFMNDLSTRDTKKSDYPVYGKKGSSRINLHKLTSV